MSLWSQIISLDNLKVIQLKVKIVTHQHFLFDVFLYYIRFQKLE